MELSNISTITADIQKIRREASGELDDSTKFVDALPKALTRQLDLFPQNDQVQASPPVPMPPKRTSVLPSILIAPQPNPSPVPVPRSTSAPSSFNLVNSNMYGSFGYGGQAGLFSMLQQRSHVARFSHTRNRMDWVSTQPLETRQIARHCSDGDTAMDENDRNVFNGVGENQD